MDFWVYQVGVSAREGPTDEIPDLTGFDVVTTDDHKIGYVEQPTSMGQKSWIVVDTGFWIFASKRMIPAGAVDSIECDEGRVRLALSRDAVKTAPDFDEVRRYEAFYQGQLEGYYRGSMVATPESLGGFQNESADASRGDAKRGILEGSRGDRIDEYGICPDCHRLVTTDRGEMLLADGAFCLWIIQRDAGVSSWARSCALLQETGSDEDAASRVFTHQR